MGSLCQFSTEPRNYSVTLARGDSLPSLQCAEGPGFRDS